MFYNLELEERQAARYAGYTWEQYLALPGAEWWLETDGDSQAKVLAMYRIDKTLEYYRWNHK